MVSNKKTMYFFPAQGSNPRLGRSARHKTKRWPSRSSGYTRPSRTRPDGHRKASTTSRSPPPSGSTGSTTVARSSTATISHPSKPSRLTTLTTRTQRPPDPQTRKSPDSPGRFKMTDTRSSQECRHGADPPGTDSLQDCRILLIIRNETHEPECRFIPVNSPHNVKQFEFKMSLGLPWSSSTGPTDTLE